MTLKTGCLYAAQTNLKLLGSSHPPTFSCECGYDRHSHTLRFNYSLYRANTSTMSTHDCTSVTHPHLSHLCHPHLFNFLFLLFTNLQICLLSNLNTISYTFLDLTASTVTAPFLFPLFSKLSQKLSAPIVCSFILTTGFQM